MKGKELIKYILLFSIHYTLFTILISCDKIEAPFTKQSNSSKTDTTIYERHILLEEFTGFKCGNCPAGQKILDSLEKLYPNKLISYGVNAGFFAQPDNSGDFIHDYRTTVGNDLDNKFQISALGLPRAMINRITDNNTKGIDVTQWAEIITNLLSTPPNIDLVLVNSFDASTYNLLSTVYVHTLDTISQPLVLSVYIIEDSIKDYQEDYNPTSHVIANYVHKNVLRGSLNATWGDDLQNGALPKDQFIIRSYKYTLHQAWKYRNIYTVAFVYNRNTNVVLQCLKTRII